MNDAAVPAEWLTTPENRLRWLSMCIQGLYLLLQDPEPGLFTWHEACDRGWRRVGAACLAVAAAIPGQETIDLPDGRFVLIPGNLPEENKAEIRRLTAAERARQENRS